MNLCKIVSKHQSDWLLILQTWICRNILLFRSPNSQFSHLNYLLRLVWQSGKISPYSSSPFPPKMALSVAAPITTTAVRRLPSSSSDKSLKLSHFSSLHFPSELRSFRSQCIQSKLRRRTLAPVITHRDKSGLFGFFLYLIFRFLSLCEVKEPLLILLLISAFCVEMYF